jgi:hypothetical protein
MNWRGGMFRIWIVASLVWIGLVSFVAYQKIIVPRLDAAEAQRCAQQRSANHLNPFDCFDPDSGAKALATPAPLADGFVYAALAIGPICGVFICWFIGEWISVGFMRSRR